MRVSLSDTEGVLLVLGVGPVQVGSSTTGLQQARDVWESWCTYASGDCSSNTGRSGSSTYGACAELVAYAAATQHNATPCRLLAEAN